MVDFEHSSDGGIVKLEGNGYLAGNSIYQEITHNDSDFRRVAWRGYLCFINDMHWLEVVGFASFRYIPDKHTLAADSIHLVIYDSGEVLNPRGRVRIGEE